jgi:uncharacterized repeat protein (TIGR01451 family)
VNNLKKCRGSLEIFDRLGLTRILPRSCEGCIFGGLVSSLVHLWVKVRLRRLANWAWAVAIVLPTAMFATDAWATVTITSTTNAATLATAISAGNSGITLTGTSVLTGPGATASGTFTSTSSNLGVAGGIVLSTGNASAIPGATPGTLLDTVFSNTATGQEYDIATFTFSFIPIPGVNRMSVASVFTSEEYLEYVGQGYSDNFSMVLNGGAYTNNNIATIPGTNILTDIDSVNNTNNAAYYRNNPATGTAAIPDIRMDGATTVFINAFDVVPGTTYTLTIRVADVKDARYDSAVFVSTSTVLNNPPALDLSNSLAGTGYTTVYEPTGAAVAIAAADDRITDDGTTISSATITLTNPQIGDVLTAGTLPSGIAASAYNSGTGVITLTGVSTLANYQAAIRAITFSNTAAAAPNRIITVVVSDGVDNSNTTQTTIIIAATMMSMTKTAAAPTINLGSNNSITDQGDRITFTYVITNTGTLPLTGVVPVDPGPLFNGIAGTNTLGAFSPASATLATGASQTFTATYTLSASDITNAAGITNGVSNTARASGTSAAGAGTSPSVTARTSITSVASIGMTKTAGAPGVAAGLNPSITDAGDTIVFTYLISNTGSVALTNAFPSDVGPRFNGVNGTNTLGAFSPAAPVSIAAGGSATFTATYTLSAQDVYRAAGITSGVTNTANATASFGSITVNAPPAAATGTIIASPRVLIVKSFVLTDVSGGTAGRADRNETITYSYVVQNNGNVALTNVSVNDLHGTPGVAVSSGVGGINNEILTPGVLGVSASTPDATANNGIWSILAPGATVTFTYVHTVTLAEFDLG